MPTARGVLGGSGGGKIYAIGGSYQRRRLGCSTESGGEYDPVSTPGHEDDDPAARFELAAAELGRRIYAIGGRGGGNVVEEYDPASNTGRQRRRRRLGIRSRGQQR